MNIVGGEQYSNDVEAPLCQGKLTFTYAWICNIYLYMLSSRSYICLDMLRLYQNLLIKCYNKVWFYIQRYSQNIFYLQVIFNFCIRSSNWIPERSFTARNLILIFFIFLKVKWEVTKIFRFYVSFYVSLGL